MSIYAVGVCVRQADLNQLQKPKLKVGKARPKPTNFTDTSFKSKCKLSLLYFDSLFGAE